MQPTWGRSTSLRKDLPILGAGQETLGQHWHSDAETEELKKIEQRNSGHCLLVALLQCRVKMKFPFPSGNKILPHQLNLCPNWGRIGAAIMNFECSFAEHDKKPLLAYAISPKALSVLTSPPSYLTSPKLDLTSPKIIKFWGPLQPANSGCPTSSQYGCHNVVFLGKRSRSAAHETASWAMRIEGINQVWLHDTWRYSSGSPGIELVHSGRWPN